MRMLIFRQALTGVEDFKMISDTANRKREPESKLVFAASQDVAIGYLG